MAARLLAYEVADLCLGKPPLRALSSSDTISDALAALKSAEDDHYISVWNYNNNDSECIGKVCMVDILSYLCRLQQQKLISPAVALKSPISVLLSKGLIRHVDPSSSLLEAIDLILDGAQNLVVPIRTYSKTRREFCWLTQEDVIRFLLSSIGLFSPVPTLSIETLGIISNQFFAVDYYSPALSAIEVISSSVLDQTSVAVTDDEGILIGEISPFTLNCCDETAAAAITTLSAGDLMAYLDYGGPPEEIVRTIQSRLKEKKLEWMMEEFVNVNIDSSSSDEELASPKTPLMSMFGRYSRSSSCSARMVRRPEAMVCHPGSSLVAVMVQAIAHRVNYLWVIEDDCSVTGIVTFANMLQVFREILEAME